MNDKSDDNEMMERLDNLIEEYIKHMKYKDEIMNKVRTTENKMEIKDLCAKYEYHKGYCKAVVQWMQALGLNPDNDYISKRLGIKTEEQNESMDF